MPDHATFDPAAHQRLFRDVLGTFATGVTIVTAATPDGPLGMTANSFASLSLDPPLVLWSPARASGRFAAFAAADRFAIHVLGADQHDLATGFGRHRAGPPGTLWEQGPDGPPLLPGCLARLICQTHASHDGGDHLLIIGRVLQASHRPGPPLVFHGGTWGGFQPHPPG
jgi:flavin reductase (DIM6/NTAB) family NADH-FMN oxidoreductase RutF